MFPVIILAFLAVIMAAVSFLSRDRMADLCIRASRKVSGLPFWVRHLSLRAALALKPVAGGIGQNGATVLIKVNTSTSSGDEFDFIGGQAGLTLTENTAEIDLSDKLSGRLGERTPGRATATVSIELNFLRTDPVIAFLKGKYRNRQTVEVMVFDRDNLDALLPGELPTGDDVESCTGIITDFSETHPDNEKSTISLVINLNNDWVAAV